MSTRRREPTPTSAALREALSFPRRYTYLLGFQSETFFTRLPNAQSLSGFFVTLPARYEAFSSMGRMDTATMVRPERGARPLQIRRQGVIF